MNRRGVLGISGVVFLTTTACGEAAPAEPAIPVTAVEPENYAASWIGTYLGPGAGSIMGVAVTTRNARFAVALDVDSVRSERCPHCVTITLDTLFSIANVTPKDPIRLDVTVSAGGYRRTLIVDRFSGGGRTANILQGRLLMAALDGSGVTGDITYLLERR